MCKIKPCLILLSAILVIALASCGMDPSGGSGERYSPLECTISTSVELETHGGETWFPSGPVDVTFTFNQDARISYAVSGPSGSSVYESHTVQGRSFTVRCDKDCEIRVNARTDNSSFSPYYSVRFKNLGKVRVNFSDRQEPVTGGTVEVVSNNYTQIFFDIDSFVRYEWMSQPQVRYTTDGSDPHYSPTVKVVQMDENMCMEYIQLTPDMTRIRAYAVLEGWKSSPDTDIKIEIARTQDPVVSESDILPYGDPITVTPGEEGSVLWYTTNGSLTAEDLEPDSWPDDPSGSWVRIPDGGTLSVPEGKGEYYLKFIASEDGKRPSEIIEKTYHVLLPKPEPEKDYTDAGNQKVTAVFSRGGGPSDSAAYYSTDKFSRIKATELDDGTGRFSVTVSTGTQVSVWLEKEGYIDSVPTVVQPIIKLAKPTAVIDYKGETKYRLVTLKSTDEGVTIHYILNGVEKTYTNPIEIRQTATITAWAEKDNHQQSDNNSIKVTVKYNIGDRGPAGGTIVHAAGEGYYYELAPKVFTNVIFGYYATKDGGRPQLSGATFDDGYGSGERNTDLLRKMVGHTYASAKVNAVSGAVTDAFAIKMVLDYSTTQTINGEVVTFDDWYLPSRSEMEGMLRRQKDHEEGLDSKYLLPNVMYWCSTEADSSTTMTYVKWSTEYPVGINAGTQSRSMKNNYYAVMLRRF